MRMGFPRIALMAVLGLAFWAGAVAVRAQEKPAEPVPDLAILIVGDEGNAAMVRDEKALIAEMTKMITGKGEPEANRDRYAHVRALQVYSYHFNQAREKQYCEKKLNILAEDLLFVGLVELKDRLPRRVVYRLDRIVRARRAAEDVLARAEEMLAPPVAEGSASPSPAASPQASPRPATSASPAASPSPSPKPAPAAGPSAWTVQVGSFAELGNAQELVERLKEKGHESRIEHTSKGGANLFRVYVGSYPTRQGAQAVLDRLKADGFDRSFLVAPEEG